MLNRQQKVLHVALILGIVALVSCKNVIWQPKPPIPGLEKEFQTFSFDATTGITINVPGGTIITIPPSCFVDVNGNTIRGTVDVKYREFHDGLDVFLAGIPMDIGSMGEKRTLQTAGMFEIKAFKDNLVASVAPGKKIDIRFASKYPGVDYNFFYLNPESGSWEFVDYATTEPNLEKAERLAALQAKSPAIKFPFSDYFVLNKYMLLDVYFKDNYDKIWENRENKKIWKMFDEYGLKYYAIRTWGEVKFERGYYHPVELVWKSLDEKRFPKWVENIDPQWEKKNDRWVVTNMGFTPEGDNTYTIFFKEKGGRHFTKRAQVVMPIKSLLRYKASEWQKKYDDAMANLRKEQQEIDMMAEAYRTFSINRLGIFNYDKLLKMDDWFDVEATFSISETTRLPEGQSVIMIMGDNSGYYTLSPKDFGTMRINPQSKHRILSLMPDKSILMYPVAELEKMNSDSLRALGKPHVGFDLQNLGKATDAVALREMLGFK